MGENTAQKCKSVPASELPTVPRYLCLSPGSCCCLYQTLRPDIILPYPGKWGTRCCSLLQGKSRCTMPRSCSVITPPEDSSCTLGFQELVKLLVLSAFPGSILLSLQSICCLGMLFVAVVTSVMAWGGCLPTPHLCTGEESIGNTSVKGERYNPPGLRKDPQRGLHLKCQCWKYKV